MKRRDNLLNGMIVGAGLMYYLDPDKGRRRRAMVRDQVVHLTHKVDDALDTAMRDLRNRTRGLAAEARGRMRREQVNDTVVEARVRTQLGRLVSHPGSIDVIVRDGRVVLGGQVLASEHPRLVSGVRSVRGVSEVIDNVIVHGSAGQVPGLQGNARTPQPQLDVLQENWSPATRMLMGIAGGILAIRGMRGGPVGSLAGIVGMGIMARAVTNLEMRRLVGMDAGRRAVDIHKIITINAPVGEVFSFWSNYENFPRFMSHLREVRNTGENRSHWVADVAGGLCVEWDAETTMFEPNEAIGWKSIGTSPIQNAGVVRFERVDDHCTRVDVRMSYNPPAGAIGHAVAAFLGADPRRLMDEDLVRLKSLLEEGKTTAHHHAVMRDEVRRAIREMEEEDEGF